MRAIEYNIFVEYHVLYIILENIAKSNTNMISEDVQKCKIKILIYIIEYVKKDHINWNYHIVDLTNIIKTAIRSSYTAEGMQGMHDNLV